MKKFIITSILAIAPFITFAQANPFDKFKDVEGIASVTLNKELFNIAGSLDAPSGNDKAQKCLEMVKNLDNLRIFTTSEKKHARDMRNAVSSYLKSSVSLKELFSVNDKGSKIKLYVKEGSTPSQLTEALLFVDDNDDKEVVLMTFTGNVNLNDIKNLK